MNEKAYVPQPGDKVLCDPEFSKEFLARGSVPKCTATANVLQVYGGKYVKVEIIDERRDGKRIWTNTDTHGCQSMCLVEAVILDPNPSKE